MKPATISHKNSSNKHFATCSIVTPTGKEDAFEKEIAGKVAYHYLARGVWLRWPRASHESLPRDPLRRLCSSLQQGHLLPQRRCQVHLPSWHKTWVTRSSHGRRTGMGLARCSFTCHISASASKWAEMLYSALSSYKQHLRQKERHCQEAHSYSSCHHDFSRDWLGCRWLQWHCMAVSQQRQPQYYWRSFYGQYLAYATGPSTTVGTWIHSWHVGRRLWISQTTWLSTLLESA